tara:strand:- start:66 stop:485 length:420 start_codon:yes stop_codon:yes gene_type:complete
MTVKLLTLKPKQDVIADIQEIRTKSDDPQVIGYQLRHPYVITLSRLMKDGVENPEHDSISVNISRWNPFSTDIVYQIPADIVNVICEPLPRLKQTWEEKTKAEEEVASQLGEPPTVDAANTVIEQELLNEERTDSDTKE